VPPAGVEPRGTNLDEHFMVFGLGCGEVSQFEGIGVVGVVL
jgi:hypothetical protein